jgi:hypothetical protein
MLEHKRETVMEKWQILPISEFENPAAHYCQESWIEGWLNVKSILMIGRGKY